MATALLFPGQGAQVVGMGVELAGRSQLVRSLYEEAADILGFDLLELCRQGPADELGRTEFCQPALFVHSYAALRQLELEQPELWNSVTAVAGLSLGEYTAVAAAGGLSFAHGVQLVQARGRAMQQAADATPSGMSSILGLERDQVDQICQRASTGPTSFVQPANLLCPGNIAISGHLTALAVAEELATQAGAMRTVRLPVAGAFHTAIMNSAVESLVAALEQVQFAATRVPVYSNVDALPHHQPDQFRDLLTRQVVSPVMWEDTVRALIASGVDRGLEIGSGRVLTGTVKRIHRKTICDNFGD